MSVSRSRSSRFHFAFGVGFNNFATGRGTMKQLVEDAHRILDGATIVTWYGATGNFAVRTDLSNIDLAVALNEAFGRCFAVVTQSDIDRVISTCDAWRRPTTEHLTRWTAGGAFRVDGPPPPARFSSTIRGRFHRVNGRSVAVLKRDLETAAGRLDSARRQGGWGAISGDIARQTGGRDSVWTARSMRAIRGLSAKADRNVAVEPSQ
jgi:hypothetical protein